MNAVTEKTLKVVQSCINPQQLEIAENFAQRAKVRMDHEEWLDIASAINVKAGQVLFFDSQDWTVLRRA